MSTLNRIYIACAVLIPVVLAILLQFIPLTNTTGFEFSFILSIPLFLSGGLISIVNPSAKLKSNLILAVLFIPFIISIISNVFFSICPIGSDALFYLVISIPAFIVGFLLGVFIYNNIRLVRLGYLLISLQILLMFSLAEFYFLPQVYFYNPVFGFLPGTIYDQLIPLTWDLVIYRIIVMFFFFILSRIKCSKKENNFLPIIILPLLIGIWFVFLKPWLGYSTTEAKIENELNQVLKTEHFEIFTDSKIPFDTTSLKSMHEFYYQEIKSELDLKDESRIKSYIFKDRKQKKELFGSENADVAKPWLRQIYVDQGNFTRSLKHELVHILAGQFGNKPFDISANPSLVEGIAVAVENNYDDKNIDYIVSLAIESGQKTELTSLFSGMNFFGNASSKSYLFAGSFIKYLLNTYGVRKVKRLYKTSEFESIYKRSIYELEKEFNKYLLALGYEENSETPTLYFGFQPLIRKICPRVAARVEKEGWELYQDKFYEDALKRFQFIFNATGSYSSLNGILLSKFQLEEYEEALKLAQENVSVFRNTSYFYGLELRIADFSVMISDSSKTREIINNLINQEPSLNYYNTAVLRNLLLNEGVEYYSEFLLGGYEKKILLLKDLKNEKEFDCVVPSLIEYSKNIDEGDKAIKNVLSDYLPSLTPEGIYSSYKLSRYYFALGEFGKAEEYADYALKNNIMKEYENTFDENYRLIKWTQKN